jgi:hypothetical protein
MRVADERTEKDRYKSVVSVEVIPDAPLRQPHWRDCARLT